MIEATQPLAPASDDYCLRTATTTDWEAASATLGAAFGQDLEPDTVDLEHQLFEPDRTVLAVRGDEVAGVASAYTRQLTVPGAVVPAAHVTMVGVHPTHRRRGLLTRMMHRQLADVRALGEPLALLWASEATIYQRFGYGLAASRLHLSADREVRMREPAGPGEGRLRQVPPSPEVLAPVYDAVRAERVGWSERSPQWWEYVLGDVPSRRRGRTRLRAMVHEGRSGVDGYALWRVSADWDPSGPKNTVAVREVVAANPDAYRALWRLLLDMDLARAAEYQYGAVDEPLYHLVTEPRRLGVRLQDALWVRLVDVGAALTARRYLTPVDVVLDVTDPLLAGNSGRWHLAGDGQSASCTRTQRPADLAVEVSALAAAYLGGTTLGSLAATGRVTELVPGRLAAASTALGWHRPPSATENF